MDNWDIQIFSLSMHTLNFMQCLNVEGLGNTSFKKNTAGGVVAQVYNPSTQEAMAGAVLLFKASLSSQCECPSQKTVCAHMCMHTHGLVPMWMTIAKQFPFGVGLPY